MARTGTIILLILISVGAFIYGSRALKNWKQKLVLKDQIEKIDKKIDSLFLENRKLIRTLSSEKDSIYYVIRETVNKMDTIYMKSEVYVVPEDSTEIINELKRLSK